MKPLQPENNAVPPKMDETDEQMREVSAIPAAAAPGEPPAPPLTRELLYKGAAASRALWAARRAYPALWKLAAEIGKIKTHASPMQVTAIGEGDSSRLKIKPWQLNGQEAWDSLDDVQRSR